MGLASDIAEDWATFTDPVDGFGDNALFYPVDGNGSSFPITVTVGDVTPTVLMMHAGQEGHRTVPFFTQKSVIVAGILTITSASRDCRRGDSFVIAAPSANAGTWTIMGPPSQDVGDGIQVEATLATLDAPGSEDSLEVR